MLGCLIKGMCTEVLASFPLPFALLYFVQLLTYHPEGPSGFARTLFQPSFSSEQRCPAGILSLCFSMLWYLVTKLSMALLNRNTFQLLQEEHHGCSSILALSGGNSALFLKLFSTTWESVYKFPSPSGSFRLLHSLVALKPCYIESLHFTSFAEELPCKRETSSNLVQFTLEKLLLLLIFTFSTCLSLFSIVSNLYTQLRWH